MLTILVILSLMLFFYFFPIIIQKIKRFVCVFEYLTRAQLLVSLFIFVLSTKVLLVFLLDTTLMNHGDMPAYFSFAKQFAEQGYITEDAFYAYTYPYATLFGWFLSPAVKLFGNDYKVVAIYMSVIYSIISVLLFDIIFLYAGKTKTFLGLLTFNIFPSGLLISQVIVHESALLFFFAISLWLFLRFIDTSLKLWVRVLALAFSSLFISFGACINYGGIVVIISYLIYSIVWLTKNKQFGINLLKFMGIFLCFFMCFFMLYKSCEVFIIGHIEYKDTAEKRYAERVKENRLSFISWPFYVGCNTKTSGEFDKEDYERYNAFYDIEDSSAAKEYQFKIIEERLTEFKESVYPAPKTAAARGLNRTLAACRTAPAPLI